MSSTASSLILASTSRYRAALLNRLGLPFVSIASEADEGAMDGETSSDLACRLARAKARGVWALHPGAVVIGSDQVADLDGMRLGKPGTEESAVEQLQACSGRTVKFYTAVCVLAPNDDNRDYLDITEVKFRDLDPGEIRRYVATEKPLDCAGAFKAEALGISLFRSISSQDPTALTGLPLIWLSQCLRELGFPNP